MGYAEARSLQHSLVEARRENRLPQDLLLLLEHPPTFTLGRRGGTENLTVPESFLLERGIPLIQAERGGDITFHGPGQLVGYPVMDLASARLSVTALVEALEEVMIRTAAARGLRAERNRLNRGVWAGGKKLGSVGIAIRHGISYHGFALNVNPDLTPFGWINPCGLRGVQMTSLEAALSLPVPMAAVQREVKAVV